MNTFAKDIPTITKLLWFHKDYLELSARLVNIRKLMLIYITRRYTKYLGILPFLEKWLATVYMARMDTR